MKRPSREINIFNISALDLFAAAMGAFIIITVILFPYYMKNSEAVKQKDKALQKVMTQQKKITALKKQNQQLQNQNKQLQTALERSVKFALLGIATSADSFVVLVDMSGSMKAYAVPMQATVSQLAEPLNVQTTLQMIGYRYINENVDLHNWQPPRNIAPMTAAAKRSVAGFAAQLVQNFDGGTPTHAALVEALRYDADAIILITDGEPDSPPGAIIRDITSQNAGKKEIHCVALGDYHKKPEFTAFLQELARRNRGGFVGVSK